MKAKLLCIMLVVLVFFSSHHAIAQANVGIGTDKPEQCAILDIRSTNQGLLPPRMTRAERDAIAAPVSGLLIFQKDITPGFYFFQDGIGWMPLGASGGGGGANTSLSNLQSTAINTDLLPGNSAIYSLGSASLSWKDIYFNGDVFLQGTRFISSRGTNAFFGSAAGNSSITGFYNTATGNNSLITNIGGYWNTATGYEALKNTNGNVSNGASNTGTGFQALVLNTTGSYNTADGVLTLSNKTTGDRNSALGVGAGANLPSGDNNTFLGAYSDAPFATPLSNATAIGYQATVTSSNMVKVGNTSVTSIGGYVGWTTYPSDGRFKKNVSENVPGLQFINQLRAVTYTVDVDGIDKALQVTKANSDNRFPAMGKQGLTADEIKSKQEKSSVIYSGFIAQEVEQAASKIGYRFSGIDIPKTSKDLYGLRYSDFVVPLVKSVQELNKKIDDKETVIVKQQAQLDSQQQQIDSLKTIVLQMQKEMAALNQQPGK